MSSSERQKISAATLYETCSEPLHAFGGVLALIKFLDLITFEQIVEHCYTTPDTETKLGHYRMIVGRVSRNWWAVLGFYHIGQEL